METDFLAVSYDGTNLFQTHFFLVFIWQNDSALESGLDWRVSYGNNAFSVIVLFYQNNAFLSQCAIKVVLTRILKRDWHLMYILNRSMILSSF
mgnify:CR=1 FL=1